MADTIRFADEISLAVEILAGVRQNRLQVSTIMRNTTNLCNLSKNRLDPYFLLMDSDLSSVVKYEMPSFNPIFMLEW